MQFIEDLANKLNIPSIVIYIIGGLVALILLIVYIVQSFRHKKLGYFTAILVEAGAIVLYMMMTKGKEYGSLKLFSAPNLVTFFACGFFVAYILNSQMRRTEKNNVLVVGAAGKNTKLAKSYYDSVFSGHVLSFTRSILYAYEIFLYILLGIMFGICKAVIVNEVAPMQISGFTLGNIPYYVLSGLGILIAFVKLVSRPRKD